MEQREQRVVIETDRYRITGMLNMPRDGYRSRLSDYLNAQEQAFVPLTDVNFERLDGRGDIEHRDFLTVSLSHVVLAMPDDD
jgi:hypothetical protein